MRSCVIEQQGGQSLRRDEPKASKSAPRVINVDKNASYPKAITDFEAIGVLPESVELREVKYLNNIVEQDYRFIKRLVKPGLGFFSFQTPWRTMQGYEVMNMIRKGQMRGVERRSRQAKFLDITLSCQRDSGE